jgi:hypothetical protein
MKKLHLAILLLLSAANSYAQNTAWPSLTSSSNVGIGTSTANQKLTINGGGIGFDWNSTDKKLYSPADGDLEWFTQNGAGSHGFAVSNNGNRIIYFNTNGNSYLNGGNVGIGTSMPQAKLHIIDGGTSVNGTSVYSGNLLIQANPGSRSSILGASLEFVIPANADGSNPWGQARIITVAGNTGNTDATGKLILGTRRFFDKGLGTGTTWNYGDDLVIDGTGKIGVGTLNPDAKLAVAGTIHACEVKVDQSICTPDYVFDKGYDLSTLKEVKTYIDQNHHLPEIPSAAEVSKEGINLGEMNMRLLKKIEELTLYLIEKDKQLKEQQEQLDKINNKLGIK